MNATDSASSRAAPGSTTQLTSPIRSASTAPTSRPVRIRSIARPVPISRGSRTVPPSISGTPQRRQKTPKLASRAATRRSHQIASSSPPATAYPSMAAMTGLESRIRVGPIGPGPCGLEALVHRLEVGAGAERASLAVEHRDRLGLVLVERLERLEQQVGGGAVDGVAGRRPVDGHDRHRPVVLGAHRHGVVPCPRVIVMSAFSPTSEP